MQTTPLTYFDQLSRDLLRRIQIEHEKRITTFPAPPSARPDADTDGTGDEAADAASRAKAARELDPQQATEFLGRSDAYRTDETDQADVKRPAQRPLGRMILAARFVACFQTPLQLSALGAPLAVSCLELPDHSERQRAWEDLPNILRHLSHLAEPAPGSLASVQTVVLGYRGTTHSDRARATRDFEDAMGASVKTGKTILALAPALADLPQGMHALVSHVFTLPPLDRSMILDILRQTHALSESVDEGALLDLLPPDAALARMPLALFHNAFHEVSPRAVLSRLRDLATAQTSARHTDRMTLDRIHLPPAATAFCAGLLADLQGWQAQQVAWSEVLSSACLYGPPGNGKTSLAAALAGSAGIPLVTTSYADCQKAGHQGDFLRVLADKVTEAILSAPCVFFLDELDSFGLRDKPGRNSDYVVGIVNGLLEHLSKLNDTPGVITLGATNHPHLVDPAILRPGRFDAKIHLGNPDRSGILRILEIELGAQAQDLGANDIANRLLGLSGAQVSAVVRDARARARRACQNLQPEHLGSAADHVAPPRPPALLRRIAIHEAGHAVVGHSLGLPPPRHLQLTASGGAYGYVTPDTMTVETAEDHLATLLGGRAAEIDLLGSCSSGADKDLAEATDLAYSMRYRWGMYTHTLISLSRDTVLGADPSAGTADLLNADLRHAEHTALPIIRDNKALVHRIADALLRASELAGPDLQRLLEEGAGPGEPTKDDPHKPQHQPLR